MGDGKSDLAFFDPANGEWTIRSSLFRDDATAFFAGSAQAVIHVKWSAPNLRPVQLIQRKMWENAARQ